jgi:nucleotide-binding universal stress UspA family protein
VDNILYFTDLSSPSKAALALAVRVARAMDAKIHVLHPWEVAVNRAGLQSAPLASEDKENSVGAAVKRAHLKLEELPYQILSEQAGEGWASVQKAIQDLQVNLLILGIRKRARDQKLFLRTIADEIFDRSPVPVLTIGTGETRGASDRSWFQHALVATDFAPESKAAVSYAATLADQNRALLTVVHVRKRPGNLKSEKHLRPSAAEVYHKLSESIPATMQLQFPPDFVLAYGDSAELILQSAAEQGADLIVLGISTHSEDAEKSQERARETARQVVAYANCPVLTLRGT